MLKRNYLHGLLLIAFIAFSSGASAYQLKGDLKKFYKQYTKYKGGMIESPSDEDILNAAKFGKILKNEENKFASTYTFYKNLSFGYASEIFLKVRTPLYLVSSYARHRAMEYKEFDKELAKELANIEVVNLSLVQKNRGSYLTILRETGIIILKDGVRVAPLRSIPAIGNKSPFLYYNGDVAASHTSNQIYQEMMKTMIPTLRSQLDLMPPETRKVMIKSYEAQGINIMGKEELEVKQKKNTTVSSVTSIAVSQNENYYNLLDLNDATAQYELVFRTRAKGAIKRQILQPLIGTLNAEEKEVRMPVDFRTFR